MTRSARPALLALLAALAPFGAGCRKAEPLPTVVAEAAPGPVEPGRIELSDPVVAFVAPNRIDFAVKYRFVQGRPDKSYLCEITFPGTPNVGVKPMASWQLKAEGGVIKDGVILTQPPVDKFSITVSEAVSPQAGFTVCSNAVTGEVK
jgi:hypothetical protein